jgi:hypothetical protein
MNVVVGQKTIERYENEADFFYAQSAEYVETFMP